MYIMEMIESIVWIMTGLISSLFTMEIAWRLARGHAQRVSINKPLAMKQDARSE